LALEPLPAGDRIGNGGLIDGCHGATVFPEYLRVTLDGDQVVMLWIFHVSVEQTSEEIVLKNGKVRVVESEVRTDFRMGGPYDGDDFAAWGHQISTDGVITTSGTGTFAFVHYEAGGDPMFIELENWLHEFELQIVLTPIP
jgi:hypothetical protein